MDGKEMAYAKQTVLQVKDWDAFQAVLRHYAKLLKYAVSPGSATQRR